MEVPASLVRRNLSGVEIRLANIVYGCADIRDAVPKCTLSKSRVIALLGCSENAFASACTKNAQRALLGGVPIDSERERAEVRKAIARVASDDASDRIDCDSATLVGCGLMAGAARHMNGPRDSADAKAGKRATPSALCRSWDDFVAGAVEHFDAHGARPEPKRDAKTKRIGGAASHGPRR